MILRSFAFLRILLMYVLDLPDLRYFWSIKLWSVNGNGFAPNQQKTALIAPVSDDGYVSAPGFVEICTTAT